MINQLFNIHNKLTIQQYEGPLQWPTGVKGLNVGAVADATTGTIADSGQIMKFQETLLSQVSYVGTTNMLCCHNEIDVKT